MHCFCQPQTSSESQALTLTCSPHAADTAKRSDGAPEGQNRWIRELRCVDFSQIELSGGGTLSSHEKYHLHVAGFAILSGLSTFPLFSLFPMGHGIKVLLASNMYI
jgi:hypothetical protein